MAGARQRRPSGISKVQSRFTPLDLAQERSVDPHDLCDGVGPRGAGISRASRPRTRPASGPPRTAVVGDRGLPIDPLRDFPPLKRSSAPRPRPRSSGSRCVVVETRRCVGSTRSDGWRASRRAHWRQYLHGLRKDAQARHASPSDGSIPPPGTDGRRSPMTTGWGFREPVEPSWAPRLDLDDGDRSCGVLCLGMLFEVRPSVADELGCPGPGTGGPPNAPARVAQPRLFPGPPEDVRQECLRRQAVGGPGKDALGLVVVRILGDTRDALGADGPDVDGPEERSRPEGRLDARCLGRIECLALEEVEGPLPSARTGGLAGERARRTPAKRRTTWSQSCSPSGRRGSRTIDSVSCRGRRLRSRDGMARTARAPAGTDDIGMVGAGRGECHGSSYPQCPVWAGP